MVCEHEICGIDTETELIQNHYTTPPLVLFGACSGHKVQLCEWQHFEEYQQKFLAANPTTKFAFFNGPFDQMVMGEDVWIEELNKDNRVMELQCAYPQWKIATVGKFIPGFTLERITQELLGVQLDKSEDVRLAFERGKKITEAQYVYMAFDAISTAKLGQMLRDQPTEAIQARAAFVLAKISKNGMRMDLNHLHKEQDKWQKVLEESGEKLEAFGYPLKKYYTEFTGRDYAKTICKNIGITEQDFDVVVPEKHLFSASWWWKAMALYIYGGVIESMPISEIRANVRDLLTVISTPMTATVRAQFSKDVDTNLRGLLEEIDCTACLDGVGDTKPTGSDAWKLLALLSSEYIANGDPQRNYMRDEIHQELNKKFYTLHERNMGWLKGTKPVSQAQYLQRHIKKIREQYPNIELQLTDAAAKHINEAKAAEAKAAKKEKREQKVIDTSDLEVWQVTGKERWRFDDQGIDDPFLNAYWDFKHAEKMLSTYLTDKYIEGDGRAHPHYTSYLKTGRTGCSSFNAQNLPSSEPGLRENFIPADGRVFLFIDYNQEELCAIAQHCQLMFNHSLMYNLINHGMDLHSTFAAYRDGRLEKYDLHNLSEEDIAEIKPILKEYKEDKDLSKRRKISKICNFALGGAMGEKGFYLALRNGGFKVDMETAKKLRADWFSFYPEVAEMHNLQEDGEVSARVFDGSSKQQGKENEDDVEETEEDTQDIKTILTDAKGQPIEDPDRMVKLYRVSNALGMTKAHGTKCAVANFIFQSYAAAANKIAMWWVFYNEWKRARTLGVPERFSIIVFIHDELGFEVDIDALDEVAKTNSELMVAGVKSVMPGVLIRAEATAMTRWSKSAESLYDDDGHIIINQIAG